MPKKKKIKEYSYQQVCEILCEACRLKIPMKTSNFHDTRRISHSVNGTDIFCDASDWRKIVAPEDGETVNVIIKKVVQLTNGK